MFQIGGGLVQLNRDAQGASGLYHPYDGVPALSMFGWRWVSLNWGDDSRGAHYVGVGLNGGI